MERKSRDPAVSPFGDNPSVAELTTPTRDLFGSGRPSRAQRRAQKQADLAMERRQHRKKIRIEKSMRKAGFLAPEERS